MKKINGKAILIFVWLLVIGLLIYSRFINLGWGLPYPMHPDERNMANAIQNLNCEVSNFQFPISNQISNLKQLISNCLNPHFFAYGQFPLYLGYLLIWVYKGFKNFGSLIISFEEAVMSLRLISAIASILNVFIIVKIINLILKTSNIKYQISNKTQILNDKFKNNQTLLIILITAFSPFFIQFSHFGTTESLLMLFYSLIVYFSMRFLERRATYEVVWLALISGLAIATKMSSLIFLTVPIIAFISKIKDQKLKLHIKIQNFLFFSFCFMFCTFILAMFFSPHNLINFRDFISSMNYESDVALGKSLVFYTRQFFNTVPIWFQLTKVFPYVLGWPMFILGSLGVLGGLGFKDRKINLLRFAILVYLIPNAFLFAKWTRFMAPIFPLILIFAILFMQSIIFRLNRRFWIPAFAGMTLLLIIPGISYLSVYQNPDVRFQASEWIYKNIPNNSYILSETANVVDIPISDGTMKQLNNYNVISFNFYDLDESPELQSELKDHLQKADYIFVPSRRLFANHPKDKYPLMNNYYKELFNGKLGFKEIAEFDSYPQINVLPPLTGFNWKFPDEQAEETWTVFDHPVVRIYKRIAKNPKL